MAALLTKLSECNIDALSGDDYDEAMFSFLYLTKTSLLRCWCNVSFGCNTPPPNSMYVPVSVCFYLPIWKTWQKCFLRPKLFFTLNCFCLGLLINPFTRRINRPRHPIGCSEVHTGKYRKAPLHVNRAVGHGKPVKVSLHKGEAVAVAILPTGLMHGAGGCK